MLGAGCKQCAIRRNSKAQRKKPEDYVREVSEINDTITITSKYVNGSTKICYHCNICGYDGKCKPFALLRGQGCANCNNRSVSFAECFIAASFSLMLGENEVKRRDRKLISKEIDIYIPSLNLAIEPGSWVWHKNKIRVDNEKQRLCKEKGVRLIIIYSDCYLDKSPLDHDCWIYEEDFTRSKDNITLKRIVNKLFDEVGIGKEITDGDWKTIENIAYISSRNITTTEFIKRVNPSKKGFLILGEFIDSKKPIKCKCLKCDYEWNPLASVLLYNGSACPKCAGVLKKTQEEFEKEVAEKNPSIRIIGEYINRKLPIECECRKCGKQFSRVPANILYGAGCPDCKKKEQIARSRKTPQEFEEEFKMNGDSSIVLLGRYVRTSDKIKCQCQKCNHIWDAPPRDLLKGHGCPRCKGSLKKTQEEFESELHDANPSIITMTEYKGMNKPITAKCKICGCEFETTPSSLIHNRKKCKYYRNHPQA